MLGDNPEKSKNPLKKAMRRRNAKTVQFAPPTYYDPSDNDYSSDEEGDEGEFTEISDAGGLLLQSGDPQVDQDEDAVVEPLNIKAPAKDIVSSDGTQLDLVPQPIEAESEAQFDKSRSSEELCDHQGEAYSFHWYRKLTDLEKMMARLGSQGDPWSEIQIPFSRTIQEKRAKSTSPLVSLETIPVPLQLQPVKPKMCVYSPYNQQR